MAKYFVLTTRVQETEVKRQTDQTLKLIENKNAFREHAIDRVRLRREMKEEGAKMVEKYAKSVASKRQHTIGCICMRRSQGISEGIH